MKQLFIIGAGDFGREVLEWASAMPACGTEWTIGGFLDSRPDILNAYNLPVKVVGDPATWPVKPDHLFCCAVGNPAQKMKYVNLIRDRGGAFPSIIHPTAIIGRDTRLGQGCILCPNVVLTVDITVGDFVTFNVCSGAGHDAVIGEGSTISAQCDITGHVRLGRCVFLGSHATILPKVVVGDHAVVGAGSVVLRRVRPHATVFGVPAVEIMNAKPEGNE